MIHHTPQNTSAVRDALRDQAFYFYNAIGRPNGKVAGDLKQFSEILKTVEIESINFHLHREDFEKWLGAIGEGKLAAEVSKLRMGALAGEPCRKELCRMVEAHLRG